MAIEKGIKEFLTAEMSPKGKETETENNNTRSKTSEGHVSTEEAPFLGHGQNVLPKSQPLLTEGVTQEDHQLSIVYTTKDVETQSTADTKWRWVVLSASTFAIFSNTNWAYIVGVLYIAVIEKFDSDPELTSWLGSMIIGLWALGAPLASAAIKASSCRTCVFLSGIITTVGFVLGSLAPSVYWLFITFVIVGIGQTLSNTGALLAIVYYFPSPTFAHGICLGVAGIAIIIFPVIFQAFVDSFGLHGALLVVGALSAHSCISGLLLRPTKLETNQRQRQGHFTQGLVHYFSDLLSIIGNPVFAFVIVYIFVRNMGYMSILVLLPKYCVDMIKFSHSEAAVAAMLMGTGTVLSRVSIGFLSANRRIGISFTLIGVNSLTGILSFLAPIIMVDHTGAYTFCALFGLFAGSTYSLVPPLITEILGVEKSASGIGAALLAFGIGTLVGPPITAKVMLTFGDRNVFFFAGFWWVVGTTSLLVIDRLRNFKRNDGNELNISIEE